MLGRKITCAIFYFRVVISKYCRFVVVVSCKAE